MAVDVDTAVEMTVIDGVKNSMKGSIASKPLGRLL
jgi:hypothetical protein